MNTPIKKGMIDTAPLRTLDTLVKYAHATLGKPTNSFGKLRYPCPFGAHSRPKLELSEWHGRGRFKCWACGCDGDVFDLARHLTGKSDFREIAQEVAELTGYSHLIEPSTASIPRPARHVPKPAPLAPPPPPVTEFTPDVEKRALAAVAKAHAVENRPALEARAHELGLPYEALHLHTSLEHAHAGLVGLDNAGHLLYVYTVTDEVGTVRVFSIKTRHFAHDVEQGKPKIQLHKGSRKRALFGAEQLPENGRVLAIITEGESDFFALWYSVHIWHEWNIHNTPNACPPPEAVPIVVAKPDAGGFKPEWTSPLVGADVILVVDDDDAGRKGAAKTAEMLQGAGVHSVYYWTPPTGCKDARDAFNQERPWGLIQDVLINKTQNLTIYNQ